MNAVKTCENYLQNDKEYNLEKRILGSQVEIIDRMLSHRLELKPFYEELTLDLEECAWQRVLAAVIDTAAHWDPENASKARDAKRRLAELNVEIEKAANQLASLIDERTEICEYSGYGTDYEYHIIRLIHESEKMTGHYDSYIRKPIENLRREFGLKYWPKVSQVVSAIARDSANLEVHPTDTLTAASTVTGRSSKSDYLRVFFTALIEESRGPDSTIPVGYTLTDNSIAAVLNSVLALPADELVDASYVKRFRQRERESGR